jgi:hypothetical protein
MRKSVSGEEFFNSVHEDNDAGFKATMNQDPFPMHRASLIGAMLIARAILSVGAGLLSVSAAIRRHTDAQFDGPGE